MIYACIHSNELSLTLDQFVQQQNQRCSDNFHLTLVCVIALFTFHLIGWLIFDSAEIVHATHNDDAMKHTYEITTMPSHLFAMPSPHQRLNLIIYSLV